MIGQARATALVALASVALACGPKQPTTPPAAGATASFENPGGMWMPSQLAEHAETLQGLGVELEPGALTDPMAFPLGAVVSLGGCSASFVSPKGLVITNHHCATGYLQANSSPDANLLSDGYLAKTMADEKPGGPGSRIYVTQAITDVTGAVLADTDAMSDAERATTIAKRRGELAAQCTAKAPTTSCVVSSYFDGAQFFEIERLEIRDVRLVYAPDAGVGVFGGEVDNWRWPRHTGDYSFIRAYVGPDGKPADPSADNIPYEPKHFLKVATKPLAADDFVMVAGYPGRTYRLKTAADVQEAMSWRYPREIVRYDELIGLLTTLGNEDPKLAIKAASQLRRLANYRTNFKGMIDGLREGGLAAKKEGLEKELQTWIEADPERTKLYGSVLADMAVARAERTKFLEHDAAVSDLMRAGELLGWAQNIAAVNEMRDTLSAEAIAGVTAQLRGSLPGLVAGFDPRMDTALVAHGALRAVALPEGQRPDAVLEGLLGAKAWKKVQAESDETKRTALVTKAVATMFAKTKLATEAGRSKALDALAKPPKPSRDPLLAAVTRMLSSVKEVEARRAAYDASMDRLRPQYVAAMRGFSPTPLAPDANGTLRITYGTVRGYSPTPDDEVYVPFTTIGQMVAKHTGEAPFNAPKPVLEAAARGEWGAYGDEVAGELTVNFLADLDITGGNSGSATLNARGELVGLAFDGNYESIASDWLFAPQVARSIHVDIRYVLWLMDAVDGADHLLQEMGVTPSVEPAGAAPAQAAPADKGAAPAPVANEAGAAAATGS